MEYTSSSYIHSSCMKHHQEAGANSTMTITRRLKASLINPKSIRVVYQSPSVEGAFEYPAICGICLFLSYYFVTKLLELNPARMRGCEGEGDGDGDSGCGNVVLSNLESSFRPIYLALFGCQASL